MKVYKKLLGLVFLMLFGVGLIGCDENQTYLTTEIVTTDELITTSEGLPLFLESISVNKTSLLDIYTLDTLKLNEIQLILNFNQDFQSSVSLNESMIIEDLDSITGPGTYVLHVNYLNHQTSFTINITDPFEIETIAIDQESYNPYGLISSFDISTILLNVKLTNGDMNTIPLSFDYIDEADTNKLFSEGLHEISVNYGGFETNFIIVMIKNDPINNPKFNLTGEAPVFYEVLELLQKNHYSSPSLDALYAGATQGMIDSLGDPFTTLFDRKFYFTFNDRLNETFIGTGIFLSIVDDLVVVTSIIEGSPAEQAGIQLDDIIKSINGVGVNLGNINVLYDSIMGEAGLTVIIEVERFGQDKFLEYSLITKRLKVESLSYEIKQIGGKKIGIIKVKSFSEPTNARFIQAIEALEAENIDNLIIDLRNNTGGYLSSVSSMLKHLLLDDGKPVITMEYAYQEYSKKYYGDQTEKKPYDIITLVNGRTASAAEIFASAMQEHGNYIIIGEQTYGKGVAQTTRSLYSDYDKFLHITSSKWLTPLGNWVDNHGGTHGITPDIVVRPNQYESAKKLYLHHDDILTYDSVNSMNINLQVILNCMGYQVRTDGYYDLETKIAIEDLQSIYELDISGNVNIQTAKILNNYLVDYQNNTDTQLDYAIQYLKE